MNKEEFFKLLEKYNSKTLTHNEEQDFLSAIRSKQFKKLVTKELKYCADSTILEPPRINEGEPYIAVRYTRKPPYHPREEKIKKIIWITLIVIFTVLLVLTYLQHKE